MKKYAQEKRQKGTQYRLEEGSYKASPELRHHSIFFFFLLNLRERCSFLFLSFLPPVCTRRPVRAFWSNVDLCIVCACKYIICMYIYICIERPFLRRRRARRVHFTTQRRCPTEKRSTLQLEYITRLSVVGGALWSCWLKTHVLAKENGIF